MRYLAKIAYDGTNYSGWQRQNSPIITIQQTIEDTLTKLWKKETTIFGCGRTDAGVHASEYFFHVDFDGPMLYDPVVRLNLMLPQDIRVLEFYPVSKTFHAQYSAIKRTYKYHYHTKPNPFKQRYSVFLDSKTLDKNHLDNAIHCIRLQSDFKSMCKKPNQYKDTICSLFHLSYTYQDNDLIFSISANRFLQSMVRLLMARIIEISTGKMDITALETCFQTGQAPTFPTKALAKGLFLSKVEYTTHNADG